MGELSTVISVGGIAALVTLFFNSFKGGYEIRRNMFRVSAMADKNIGNGTEKFFYPCQPKTNRSLCCPLQVSQEGSFQTPVKLSSG